MPKEGPKAPTLEAPEAPWLASPRIMAWISLISLAVGLFGSIPSAAPILGIQVPGVEFAFGMLLMFALLASISTIAQARRNHFAEAKAASEVSDLKSALANSREQLDREEKSNSDLTEDALKRAQFVSEMFCDIARHRAANSVALHSIRESGPHVDLSPGHLREKEWRSYVGFLEDYCIVVSRLFTRVKSGKCYCNMKFFLNERDISDDIFRIEFGTRSDIGIKDTYYMTIARCHASRMKGRFIGDKSSPVHVSKNFVFRRLLTGAIDHFASTNIRQEIEQWKSMTKADGGDDFLYPDNNPLNYYPTIMSVPIMISGDIDAGLAPRSQPFNRIIGILTIDSDEVEEFNEDIDLIYCKQIAYDLASSYFEYIGQPPLLEVIKYET